MLLPANPKSKIQNPRSKIEVERASGFEPEIVGVADRRLWPLGYTRGVLVSSLEFLVSCF